MLFTGAFATWGTQFQQAVDAYQAVNGKSVKGPDGKEHEIQFIYRDNASAGPDKTKQLAEELVLREKVKFLAGFDLSPHAMAVADIATQAKIPVVIMNAATASITRGSPYYVRVSMTIPQHVVSLAKWAYDNGIRKVYTIVSDYAPGYDAENYFNKTFKALGGEIVGSARTPQQETNYAAYMEKVLQAKPDALYMFQPAGSPSIAFVKSYVERGLKTAGIKLIGTGETQQLFLPNFTDDVIGVVTAFHYTETNTNPENIALKSQLVKMFGDKAVPDIASVTEVYAFFQYRRAGLQHEFNLPFHAIDPVHICHKYRGTAIRIFANTVIHGRHADPVVRHRKIELDAECRPCSAIANRCLFD